jgi:hypothetical protein
MVIIYKEETGKQVNEVDNVPIFAKIPQDAIPIEDIDLVVIRKSRRITVNPDNPNVAKSVRSRFTINPAASKSVNQLVTKSESKEEELKCRGSHHFSSQMLENFCKKMTFKD